MRASHSCAWTGAFHRRGRVLARDLALVVGFVRRNVAREVAELAQAGSFWMGAIQSEEGHVKMVLRLEGSLTLRGASTTSQPGAYVVNISHKIQETTLQTTCVSEL